MLSACYLIRIMMQKYKKKLKEWKKVLLLFVLILLFCMLLRVGRVLADQQSVFGDEAIYIRWAQVMRAEPGLRFLPLSDGKQPLFMWALMPVLKVVTNPLFAGRLLSVLSGVGTLLGVFCLTYLLFSSKEVALFASFIYTLSPFAVFFDSMALVDSMLSLFGIWTFIFALVAVKYYRFDFAMLAGFSLGGALLTKSPAVFFSILTPSVIVFSKWPKDISRKVTHALKLFAIFIPTYLIGYGMYNILRLGVNFHLISERNKDYIFPISHLFTNPKDPFIFHVKEIINWIWLLGPGILLLFILLGLIIGIRKYRKQTLIISLWVALPLFINSMYAKVFTARYIYYVLPYIFILSSVFIFSRYAKSLIFKLLILAFVAISLYYNYLLIFNLPSAKLPKNERSGYLEEWTAGYGIKEVAEYLRGKVVSVSAGKQIVVGTEGYFGTLPDGLQMYLADVPQITVIGVGLDIKALPQSLQESKDFGNSTYLVINNSRLKADPQSLGLKLIASYPKPLRTTENKEYYLYGPQEVLYFFEVE